MKLAEFSLKKNKIATMLYIAMKERGFALWPLKCIISKILVLLLRKDLTFYQVTPLSRESVGHNVSYNFDFSLDDEV